MKTFFIFFLTCVSFFLSIETVLSQYNNAQQLKEEAQLRKEIVGAIGGDQFKQLFVS